MFADTPSQKIKLLPEHLIDQIKAGEVIERPASLLKELLENSIDANSQNIHIQIRENGLELIAIEDDGDGMNFEDLPYAFCRHATSKIEKYEDLYSLHSYGFRGEALASIASSSRVTCTTQPKSGNGGKIIFNGGIQEVHESFSATKNGTSFFIKDLFFNTPARFKFIKSKTSEKNALKRMLFSFIISHPEINFSIKWDEKEKVFFPPLKAGEDLRKRFKQLLSKKWHIDDFYLFESEYDGHKLVGLFSKEGMKGNAGKQQFLFANDRVFNDLTLHRTIMRKLEKFWGPGLSGHYVFLFQVPPSQIDVNVHPNKTHVKFFKANFIYSLITGGIEKLYNDNSIHLSKKPNAQTTVEETKYQLESYSIQTEETHSFKPKYESFNPSEQERYFSATFSPFENIFMAKRTANPNILLTINKNDLFCYYLSLCYEKFYTANNKEELTTPLLICEPFEFTLTAPQLEIFHSLGLEFDNIAENKIVLRTIPTFFGQLPVKQIVEILLLAMTHIDSSSSGQTLIECSINQSLWKRLPLNSYHYEDLLNQINFNEESQYPFLTLMNENSI